jgi:hypothetical protein
LYRHNEPNGSAKEEPLSYVLLESPFASFSTVSRVHSSLVSVVRSLLYYKGKVKKDFTPQVQKAKTTLFMEIYLIICRTEVGGL